MAKLKKNVEGRKKDRPLVLLSGLDGKLVEPTLDIAREWCWDMQGTWVSEGEWLSERPPSGALVTELPTVNLAKHLRDEKCPAVRVGALPHPDDDLMPAVLPDLAMSGRLAAEHFSIRGFKDVAYIGYKPDDPDANTYPTYAAFRDAAEEADITCHLFSFADNDVPGEPDRGARRGRDLMAWLADLPKPIGIFCFNDIMAERMALACVKSNFDIPEDVAILGYGNSMQCKITPVHLSSVDPADDERMTVAMNLLKDLMAGKAAPKKAVMVPPKGVIERRSTDVLAVADPAVGTALRFIWDNYAEDFSVADIAGAAGVDRRKLERAFKKELHRTVTEELRRKRLSVVCELLRSTSDPIADIAAKVGYRSTQYLHRAFRAAYGMTPRAYRLG